MGMYLLGSHTVTVSGGAGANFINIPQNYKHLELYIYGRGTNSGTYVNGYCRFNSDAGVNYNGHAFGGDGNSTYAFNYVGYDAHEMGNFPLPGLTADCYGVMIMSILDYSSTDKIKTIRTLNGFDVNTSGYTLIKSGLWRSTAALNSINISYPSFEVGSTFHLYGVEGSPVTGL